MTELPSSERPREKLLLRGAESLSDGELLAVLLRTGVKGQNAVQLGASLIESCGGLAGLLQAGHDQLRRPGLGPAKSAQLLAALELSRRCLAAELTRGEPIRAPTDTRRYLQAELSGLRNEVFGVLFLDTRHRVLGYETLFQGSIDGASVHPRVVVQRALAHNAAAVILAHNHPSGVAEPSTADEAITRTLRQALGLIDVRVLDHIIIAGPRTASLAELGLL